MVWNTDIDWYKMVPFAWLGVSVILAIIEAFTFALTTIWPAIGALLAMGAALLKFPFFWQCMIFVLSSLILLIFTRPLAIKYLKVGSEKTNVGSFIGKRVKLTKKVSQFEKGEAKLNGQFWTVIADDEEAELKKDSEVEIVRIEGNKLVVKPVH